MTTCASSRRRVRRINHKEETTMTARTQKKVKPETTTLSQAALIDRINDALASKDQEVRRHRVGSERCRETGEFVVTQWHPPRFANQKGHGGRIIRTHLNLEAFARELDVLAEHERVATIPAQLKPDRKFGLRAFKG